MKNDEYINIWSICNADDPNATSIWDITDRDVENYTVLADRLEMMAKRQQRQDAFAGRRRLRFGTAVWRTQRRFFRVTGYKCSHCKNIVQEKMYYCPACLYEMQQPRTMYAEPNDDGWEEDIEFFEMMDSMFDD